MARWLFCLFEFVSEKKNIVVDCPHKAKNFNILFQQFLLLTLIDHKWNSGF